VRWIRLLLLLLIAWVTMTTTHEAGHIVGGWLGGGELRQLELRPWHLPYSLFEPNPHPLLTLWMGPILGIAVPALFALIIRQKWSWFVANFCVLANGCYLATAWITGDRFIDTQQLLAAGAWPISIAAYCSITIAVGYIGFRRSCTEMLRNTNGKATASRNVHYNSPTDSIAISSDHEHPPKDNP
jgi:hypothetical protein